MRLVNLRLLNCFIFLPVTLQWVKGYTRFVEKYVTGWRKRFRRNKVYIRINSRIDLAISVYPSVRLSVRLPVRPFDVRPSQQMYDLFDCPTKENQMFWLKSIYSTVFTADSTGNRATPTPLILRRRDFVVLLSLDNGPRTGSSGIRMLWGRVNARPGTTFADHWLHWPLTWHARSFLHSKDDSPPALLVLTGPVASWCPKLPAFGLHQLLCAFSLTNSFFARSVSLLTRSVLSPTLYRPQESPYFPFCARPARVQGTNIVPLVQGASSLCMYRYRSSSAPLANSSPRSSAVPLIHSLSALPGSKVHKSTFHLTVSPSLFLHRGHLCSC